MARGDGTKEANVLIKSRGNVETSPSLDVFAIFRKFRFARGARDEEAAFKVAMEEKEGRGETTSARPTSPLHPLISPLSTPPLVTFSAVTLTATAIAAKIKEAAKTKERCGYLTKQIVVSFRG